MNLDGVAAARVIVSVGEAYLALGLTFSFWFVWRGVPRTDPHAEGATWGFRIVIMPGVVALWPLLAWRVALGPRHPPDEVNAHRRATRAAATGVGVRG